MASPCKSLGWPRGSDFRPPASEPSETARLDSRGGSKGERKPATLVTPDGYLIVARGEIVVAAHAGQQPLHGAVAQGLPGCRL